MHVTDSYVLSTFKYSLRASSKVQRINHISKFENMFLKQLAYTSQFIELWYLLSLEWDWICQPLRRPQSQLLVDGNSPFLHLSLIADVWAQSPGCKDLLYDPDHTSMLSLVLTGSSNGTGKKSLMNNGSANKIISTLYWTVILSATIGLIFSHWYKRVPNARAKRWKRKATTRPIFFLSQLYNIGLHVPHESIKTLKSINKVVWSLVRSLKFGNKEIVFQLANPIFFKK